MQLPKALRLTPDRAAWLILALAVAFSIVIRWRLAEFPLERDEGEYAYSGQLLLQGVPPYTLSYNMKLPGVYVAYAGLMAVFGESTVGVHLGLLAVNIVSIVLLFFFTWDLFDPLTAALTAACFAVLSTSASVLGMAAHATHFIILCAIPGVWLLWRALRGDRLWLFPVAGLLLGTAFVMKQQSMFFLAFAGLMTLFSFAGRRRFFSVRHFTTCLLFGVASVIPITLCCLWFWWVGNFNRFWFWSVQYARVYVSVVPRELAVKEFVNNSLGAIGANWPIWLVAAVGGVYLARSTGVPQRRTFVFGVLLSSYLCVFPGFYFRPHYFIVVLPFVAMLAAIGLVAIGRFASSLASVENSAAVVDTTTRSPKLRRRNNNLDVPPDTPNVRRRGLALALAAMVPALVIAFTAWQQRSFFFYWTPEEACRRVYDGHPFNECTVVGDYLKRNSQPTDRIAVLGSEPEIFFYANRLSATGYIYTFPLMEPQPFAARMQEEMISEIEAAKPEFLILVDFVSSWAIDRNSDQHILAWLTKYSNRYYRMEGFIDNLPSGETVYLWGADAPMKKKSRSFKSIWILRRRS